MRPILGLVIATAAEAWIVAELSDPTFTFAIEDHWFFVADGLKPKANLLRPTASPTLTPGHSFGFLVAFSPTSRRVPAQVVLRVPGSPENFGSNVGKVSIAPDRKSLTVDYEIDGKHGIDAFYWGFDSADPSGEYEMSFSIDGRPVDTYRFIARKGVLND